MDDPHRAPRDQDRSSLSDRIRRAAAQGRISEADRDIRLRNVSSAQSAGELQLIARDLDVLEATLSPGSATPTPTAVASSAPSMSPASLDAVVDRARGTFRPALVIGVAVLVLGIVSASVAGLFVAGGGTSAGEPTGDGLHAPDPLATEDVDVASPAAPAHSAYGLDGTGLRAFLADYQRRFKTPLVVNLVLYGDYAVIQVPRDNRNRHARLLFRKGEGWREFGGISANFPGSRTVDLRRLDVDALVRNIARARRTLNVEAPNQAYVIVQHIGSSDPVPSVDIHVSNEFSESGYLATRLDGTVERSYPFQVR